MNSSRYERHDQEEAKTKLAIELSKKLKIKGGPF